MRDILDSCETNETAPILANKGHLGNVEMIQKFPQNKAVHLMGVVVWVGVLVRLSKTLLRWCIIHFKVLLLPYL